MIQTVIKLKTNESLYLKDPAESVLGKKIIHEASYLIAEIGFENFTFKKLAKKTGTTEAGIYRYFENKQMLLLYISSWYWAYLSYKVNYETHHLSNVKEKLDKIIHILCVIEEKDNILEFFSIQTLRKIIINEAPKAYFQHNVDAVNKDGAFREFKNLSLKIGQVLKEANSKIKYPNSTASTIIEAAHQQVYFAQHLPSLSDLKPNKKKELNAEDFLKFLIHKLI